MHRIIGISCALLLTSTCAATAQAATGATLQPGQAVNGQALPAGSTVWGVTLKAGDLVRGRVDGNVSLRLLDSEGRPLRLLIDGQDQPREFLFVADGPGRYGLRAGPARLWPSWPGSLPRAAIPRPSGTHERPRARRWWSRCRGSRSSAW